MQEQRLVLQVSVVRQLLQVLFKLSSNGLFLVIEKGPHHLVEVILVGGPENAVKHTHRRGRLAVFGFAIAGKESENGLTGSIKT